MNYYFTGLLILMLTALAFCATPAYPRNEYLNDGTNTCSTGSFDISVEQRDSENRYRPVSYTHLTLPTKRIV